MKFATHVAWVAVFLESAWRSHKCFAISSGYHSIFSFSTGSTYLGAYLLCILAIYLDLKNYAFSKSPMVRNFLSFLHAIDGISALMLALAYYYKSPILLFSGVLFMTKCFMLHLLSRMVTGEAASGKAEITLQTTKTFLHHTGSFLFLCDNQTALMTGCWRFISMNGHAAMTLRGVIPEKSYLKLMWIITHSRNAILAIVIITCFISADIRRGFGNYMTA